MQLYPAILITPNDRFDGLQLMELPDGTLRIRSGSGNIYGLFSPWQAARIISPAEGFLIRGILIDGPQDQIEQEVVWAVVKSARACGCGGPKRESPSAEDLALLGSWDQLSPAAEIIHGAAG